MNRKEIEKLSKESKIILDCLREQVREEMHYEIEAYRKGVTVRDKWCCRQMQKFAVSVWHVNSPTDSLGFSISYNYLGMHIMYCPFCGVKL